MEPNRDLKRFFEVNTVSAKHSLSPEERVCEQNFLINSARNDDDVFVITMPLKKNYSVFRESLSFLFTSQSSIFHEIHVFLTL